MPADLLKWCSKRPGDARTSPAMADQHLEEVVDID